MSYPSVKRIAAALNIDTDTARKVRGLMDGTIDPFSDPRVEAWANTLHTPRRMIGHGVAELHAIDLLLDTCGIEYIVPQSDDLVMPRARRFVSHTIGYCNTGDSYTATVAYHFADRKWYIAHWAYFLGD
jgi:hypothetical protein